MAADLHPLAPEVSGPEAGDEPGHPRAPMRLFVLKEGDSFVVADGYGNIGGRGDGLFRNDTRVLSRLHLALAGRTPALLSAAVSEDNVFFSSHMTNDPLPPLGGKSTPEGESPIAYPVACLPQAWAAGSGFMMLQACLGLHIDGWNGAIHIYDPCLPFGIDHVRIKAIKVGASTVDLAFHRVDSGVVVFAERQTPPRSIPVVTHI